VIFEPGRLTILVLDEEFARRNAMRAMLERMGVRTTRVAASSGEAVERLRSEHIDLMIIDEAFAGSAVDFIATIRRRTRGRIQQMPIIVCIRADEKIVRAARDAGVNEMVAKPVTAESMRLRLREIVLRPRPFIRANLYVGPCRRRRKELKLLVSERRGSMKAKGPDPFNPALKPNPQKR
jgi:CheY-like chemotaxis protein